VFSALTGKFRTLTHPLRILHNKKKRCRDFENGRPSLAEKPFPNP
jgi:hypothetical protein